MKSPPTVLFSIVAGLVATNPASAVPAKPVNATSVMLLPANESSEPLRELVSDFGNKIAKINADANGKREQLQSQMADGFDKAISKAQASGDLDSVLALKAAKENFDALTHSDVPFIKNAIAFREKKTAEFEAVRLAEALKAAKALNDELDERKKEETKNGFIETALSIAEYQKSLLVWVAGIKGDTMPSDAAAQWPTDGRNPSNPTSGGTVRRIGIGGAVFVEMAACPAVSKNFWIGKFEVTQEQWQSVMKSNPSHFKGPRNPVESVPWHECVKFAEKLNALPSVKSSGFVFRLPKEHEWKTACHSGGGRWFCKLADGTSISDENLERVAWFDRNGAGTTHPVGSREPNAWGLYDMHGNVWEWTQNEDNRGRHCRIGGSFDQNAGACNGNFVWYTPWKRAYYSVGFRLAADGPASP